MSLSFANGWDKVDKAQFAFHTRKNKLTLHITSAIWISKSGSGSMPDLYLFNK